MKSRLLESTEVKTQNTQRMEIWIEWFIIVLKKCSLNSVYNEKQSKKCNECFQLPLNFLHKFVSFVADLEPSNVLSLNNSGKYSSAERPPFNFRSISKNFIREEGKLTHFYLLKFVYIHGACFCGDI